MIKTFSTLALLAALTVSASAGSIVYDKTSTPAAIAIDQAVRAENASRIYPVDPTPAYMFVNGVCTGKQANGCTSGGGAAGAASGGE